MYRFLLRPRWLCAHALLLAVAAACVSLGLWQLRRLDERLALNQRITQGLERPPVPLAAAELASPESLAYRRVEVRGRFLPSEEVLMGPRSAAAGPGYEILTPLVTADGDGLLVDRGWVPFAQSQPPVIQAAPPVGDVTVRGYLLPTRAARQAVGTPVTLLSDADGERLAGQVSVPLAPVYLVLQEQSPPSGALPRPRDPPSLSEGPHRSYAGQWFLFAAIALIGYPFLIRRRALDLAGRDGSPPSPPTDSATRRPRSRLPG